MSSDNNSNATAASWTDESTKSFVEICDKEKRRGGNTTDNSGFKADGWNRVQVEFNTANSVNYSKAQLMSKFSELKAKFKIFTDLKENSGFGWDIELKVPTAPPEVWDKYLDAHPKAKPYRHKTLLFYDLLEDLFQGKVASGKLASHVGKSLSKRKDVMSTPKVDSSTDTSNRSNSNTSTENSNESESKTPEDDENTNESDDNNDDDDVVVKKPKKGDKQERRKRKRINDDVIEVLKEIRDKKSNIALAIECFDNTILKAYQK